MASSKEKKAEEPVAAIEKKEKKEKKDKKDKKDKKEKKEKKRSETDGVHKDKTDKKEKKHKKEKLAKAVEAHLESEAVKEATSTKPTTTDIAVIDTAPSKHIKPIVRGAVVEFALPLATDKYQKKVFKIVKKAAAQQALLRGVKEVNKALRKATPKNPAGAADKVPGLVVIAGDVNPAEIIMHLPLACEDVNAPYVFVSSRGELGQAARTKRPTSVVMVKAEGRKKKAGSKEAADKIEEDSDDDESYLEQYQELVKLTQKEYAKQLKGIL